jgi:hypothetical protein
MRHENIQKKLLSEAGLTLKKEKGTGSPLV